MTEMNGWCVMASRSFNQRQQMNMMMVAKMAVQPSMAINRQRHPTSQPIMVHCRSMPHAPQPISEADRSIPFQRVLCGHQ